MLQTTLPNCSQSARVIQAFHVCNFQSWLYSLGHVDAIGHVNAINCAPLPRSTRLRRTCLRTRLGSAAHHGRSPASVRRPMPPRAVPRLRPGSSQRGNAPRRRNPFGRRWCGDGRSRLQRRLDYRPPPPTSSRSGQRAGSPRPLPVVPAADDHTATETPRLCGARIQWTLRRLQARRTACCLTAHTLRAGAGTCGERIAHTRLRCVTSESRA